MVAVRQVVPKLGKLDRSDAELPVTLDKRKRLVFTSLFLSDLRPSYVKTCNSIKLIALRPDLDAAGFDWYLREIVSTNKLAGARLDHVVEENLADRVVAIARITVVEHGKEGGVKLIVENRIGCLPN